MPSHPLYKTSETLAVMLHGGLTGQRGKTGLAIIRFAPERVVAVIDSEFAGQSLSEVTGIPLGRDIPIVATVREALAYGPQTLAMGIAPSGGKLPEEWVGDLQVGLAAGLNILNGLHTRMNADERLSGLLKPGQWIWDIRVEPPNLPIGSGAARLLPCRRVLFVGTDMAVGKMSAAIAFHRAAVAAGWKSKFIATGQTGIMLEGDGIPLDGVRIDFASGAVQQEVVNASTGRDIVFIEGQGSLLNPASTATLPLMRGSQPTHMVLVHRANMSALKDFDWITIPPLKEVVSLYESVGRAAGALAPVPVVAIALNSHGVSDAESRYISQRIERETGLPSLDVVRYGADALLRAVS